MNRRGLLALSTLLAVASPAPAAAQHEGHEHMHHPMPPGATPAPPPDVVEREVSRNASGTAWQPETTPHLAMHTQAGGFDLMFHTLLFAGWDAQGGPRGGQQAIGIGWVMGMAGRRIGRGRVLARVMLSPEDWTAGYRAGGYPLLLQTGETYGGQPLRDRQHAHDLFMELGVLYTQGLTDAIALQLYAAPAGEPALGPIAFPHRYSSSSDPLAVISHHWQDSTHISFGVLTAGVIVGRAKLEGSWFNGREPDENRADIELRRPDSYAFRAALAPTPAWALQASYGHLASPESLRPGEAVHRVTASALYDAALGAAGHWAATAVFGTNKEGEGAFAKSVLLEANVDLDGHNVLFGRGEIVEKERRDLVDPAAEGSVAVSSLSLGYLRTFGPVAGFSPGVGARGTVAFLPDELVGPYGSRVPLGGIVFLRLAIAPMAHSGH